MIKPIRIAVRLTEDQYKFLDKESKRIKESIGEIIRRLIEIAKNDN